MNENTCRGDRERKIAGIIREHSKGYVNRAWLEKCEDSDNIFRNSFCNIKNFIEDDLFSTVDLFANDKTKKTVIIRSILEFGESYNLTARQIDRALWEMGFVCTAEGCLHGVEGKKCIFYDVCSWSGKR